MYASRYVLLLELVQLVWGNLQPCSRGPDCPFDMCCKGLPSEQGYCEPLKGVGEDCQMYSGVLSWGQTPWKSSQCKCLNGLYCGSDLLNPPLGSRGITHARESLKKMCLFEEDGLQYGATHMDG